MFIERNIEVPVWDYLLLLIALMLFAFVTYKGKAMASAVRAFFDVRYFNRLLREQSNFQIKTNVIFTVASFIVVEQGVFLSLYPIVDAKYGTSRILFHAYLYLFLLIGYFGHNSIAIILSKITGFNEIKTRTEYINRLFIITLGLFLLPGVFGGYFFPVNFYGVNLQSLALKYIDIVIIVMIFNKVLQSVIQSFELKISWFYIFLYLCTLEILPLCVGYQLLVA